MVAAIAKRMKRRQHRANRGAAARPPLDNRTMISNATTCIRLLTDEEQLHQYWLERHPSLQRESTETIWDMKRGIRNKAVYIQLWVLLFHRNYSCVSFFFMTEAFSLR